MSDLSSITDRLNAATPGPWFAWHDDDGNGPEILIATKQDASKDAFDVALCDVCAVNGSNSDAGLVLDWGNTVNHANAELIAHAPEDIAYLLGRVKDLEARITAASKCHSVILTYDWVWPCPTVVALGGETE